MTDKIARILREFEAVLAAAVAAGAGEAKLQSLLDQAVNRLRDLKHGADSELFEAIFSAFFEIEAKLNMAIEAIKA